MTEAEAHPTSQTAVAPPSSSDRAPEIRLRPFEPRDADIFRDLNLAWIEALFGIEEEDRRILNDPMRYVLEPGGHIYIAEADGRPIGCCALVPLRPGVYEVAKMAVSQELRGHGVGRQILRHVVDEARRLGAHELELCTNRKLSNAIHLYESIGFQHLPPERPGTSPFARADVFMEMAL